MIDKLLGRTFYAVKEAGEPFPVDFQLFLIESTRCTSPSRDYAALCVQRLLKAAIAGAQPAPLVALVTTPAASRAFVCETVQESS